MEVSSAVRDYLESNVNEVNSFQEDWIQIRDLHSKAWVNVFELYDEIFFRLWHQLTLKLDSCFKNPNFCSKTDLIKVKKF